MGLDGAPSDIPRIVPFTLQTVSLLQFARLHRKTMNNIKGMITPHMDNPASLPKKKTTSAVLCGNFGCA